MDPPAQVLALIPVPAITHREPPDCFAVAGVVRSRKQIREPDRLAPLAANRLRRHITPAHREQVRPVQPAARRQNRQVRHVPPADRMQVLQGGLLTLVRPI